MNDTSYTPAVLKTSKEEKKRKRKKVNEQRDFTTVLKFYELSKARRVSISSHLLRAHFIIVVN